MESSAQLNVVPQQGHPDPAADDVQVDDDDGAGGQGNRKGDFVYNFQEYDPEHPELDYRAMSQDQEDQVVPHCDLGNVFTRLLVTDRMMISIEENLFLLLIQHKEDAAELGKIKKVLHELFGLHHLVYEMMQKVLTDANQHEPNFFKLITNMLYGVHKNLIQIWKQSKFIEC